MDLIITILPVVTKDLPISPRFTPYNFLSRCKFSTLTTRQPMVEFYLLTFPRFPLRKKEHKSYFGKNRTHDFRTINSRCAAHLLDHSGTDLVDFLRLSSMRKVVLFGGCSSRGLKGPLRKTAVSQAISCSRAVHTCCCSYCRTAGDLARADQAQLSKIYKYCHKRDIN